MGLRYAFHFVFILFFLLCISFGVSLLCLLFLLQYLICCINAISIFSISNIIVFLFRSWFVSFFFFILPRFYLTFSHIESLITVLRSLTVHFCIGSNWWIFLYINFFPYFVCLAIFYWLLPEIVNFTLCDIYILISIIIFCFGT